MVPGCAMHGFGHLSISKKSGVYLTIPHEPSHQKTYLPDDLKQLTELSGRPVSEKYTDI